MENEKNYWKEIVNKLIEKKLTIATMESCTGGGIANEITNISGASSVIKESYITYCNEAKIKQGVSEEIIKKYTVYSDKTAIEMAKAAKRQALSDISIGVTGQLGRIDPNNLNNNINCVWYAIINQNDEIIVRKLKVFDKDRKKQKEFVIKEIAKTILTCIVTGNNYFGDRN